jgi:hypothetical protein
MIIFKMTKIGFYRIMEKIQFKKKIIKKLYIKFRLIQIRKKMFLKKYLGNIPFLIVKADYIKLKPKIYVEYLN